LGTCEFKDFVIKDSSAKVGVANAKAPNIEVQTNEDGVFVGTSGGFTSMELDAAYNFYKDSKAGVELHIGAVMFDASAGCKFDTDLGKNMCGIHISGALGIGGGGYVKWDPDIFTGE